jgi:hypothetical protein
LICPTIGSNFSCFAKIIWISSCFAKLLDMLNRFHNKIQCLEEGACFLCVHVYGLV